MITQQGRVIAINGGDVIVNIGGVSGCPACDAGKGCGAGIFGRMLRDREVDIQVRNSIQASEGQRVNLGITETRFMRLVFALYVWPLIAGLVGMIIGYMAAARSGQSGFVSDMAGLIAGLAALALALVHSRRKLREFPRTAEVHLLDAVVVKEGEYCVKNTADKGNSESENNDLDYER